MKLTRSVEENVYDLLPEKSENDFNEETKPLVDNQGSSGCVCVQHILSRTDQRIVKCDGEQCEIKDCDSF